MSFAARFVPSKFEFRYPIEFPFFCGGGHSFLEEFYWGILHGLSCQYTLYGMSESMIRQIGACVHTLFMSVPPVPVHYVWDEAICIWFWCWFNTCAAWFTLLVQYLWIALASDLLGMVHFSLILCNLKLKLCISLKSILFLYMRYILLQILDLRFAGYCTMQVLVLFELLECALRF